MALTKSSALDAKEPIRIPLAGTYNNRVFTNLIGAPSTSGIVGLGIIGLMIVGSVSQSAKDQRFINCFTEKLVNPLTGKETFYCTKRPGFELVNTPRSGHAGTAIHIWAGKDAGTDIITAFGTTTSEIFNGTTSIGTLGNVARDITETSATGTTTLVIPCENGTAYYYPNGGTMTQITDVDFPATNVGTFAHLDGYCFIMDSTGLIYNSDLNSVSAWTSGNNIKAQMYPDIGVGLIRYRQYILAFGSETVEVFGNNGNAIGSPLSRVDQGFHRIGCISSRSMTQVEDDIFWVASTDIGSFGVYTMDGMVPKRVSTPYIEAQIALAYGGTIDLSAARIFGKPFLFVQTGSGQTYVYSVEDNMWHEWTSTYRLWYRFAGNTKATNVMYSISRESTGGKVYRINPASPVFQDDSLNYTTTIQTSKFDNATTYRKFMSRLELIGDEQSSSTPVDIQWSDDDYQTWSTARQVDLANERAYIKQLGSFRRRAFKFTNTSATPMRLEAFEVDVE